MAWRREIPPGPARRQLTAALTLHALLPTSALALFDPNLLKGFLFALGAAALLLTAIPTLVLQGGREAAKEAGRLTDPTRGPSLIGAAWALSVAAAGCLAALAWTTDQRSFAAIGWTAMWGTCLYGSGLILLSRLRVMALALLAPDPRPAPRRPERASPSSPSPDDSDRPAPERVDRAAAPAVQPEAPVEPSAGPEGAPEAAAATPSSRLPRPPRAAPVPAPRPRLLQALILLIFALIIASFMTSLCILLGYRLPNPSAWVSERFRGPVDGTIGK
jgi:hypothetical protein